MGDVISVTEADLKHCSILDALIDGDDVYVVLAGCSGWYKLDDEIQEDPLLLELTLYCHSLNLAAPIVSHLRVWMDHNDPVTFTKTESRIELINEKTLTIITL